MKLMFSDPPQVRNEFVVLICAAAFLGRGKQELWF